MSKQRNTSPKPENGIEELKRRDDALFEALGKSKKQKKRRLIRTIVIIAALLTVVLAAGISILQRHPGNGDAREKIRALVKAAEAGKQPLERLCAALHGDLAAMLRQHEPLPGELLPYLYRAVQDVSDRRNKG